MKGLTTTANRRCREATIEGGQAASLGSGEGKQIGVGDLIGFQDAFGLDQFAVNQTQSLRPEMMATTGS